MAEALLDSSTYIDEARAFKHRRRAWASNTIGNALAYRKEHGIPNLSVITVTEIMRGLERAGDVSKAGHFRQAAPIGFQILEVTTEIAFLAGEIMAKLEDSRLYIGLADTLIAATAIHHGLELITSNQKHFQRVADLGYLLALKNWREA